MGCILLKSKQKGTKAGRQTYLHFFKHFFMTKYFYCYRIYICVNNIVIFERGSGNSLERTYIEGGRRSPIKLTWMDKGARQKLKFSSEGSF